MHFLKSHPDIMITPCDIGNVTTTIKKILYDELASKILSDMKYCITIAEVRPHHYRASLLK